MLGAMLMFSIIVFIGTLMVVVYRMGYWEGRTEAEERQQDREEYDYDKRKSNNNN